MSTQQKIFETSLRLFARQGYGNTTIRDIAKEAHISVGLLFHYFPTKQALLNAHLEQAASGMQMVSEVLASKQGPLQTFRAIAGISLTGMNDQTARLLYVLMNQPLPVSDIPKQLQEKINKDRIISDSALLIATGQKLGEIRPGDPHALAMAFWGAIQGTAQILAEQTQAPMPEAAWLVGILKTPE